MSPLKEQILRDVRKCYNCIDIIIYDHFNVCYLEDIENLMLERGCNVQQPYNEVMYSYGPILNKSVHNDGFTACNEFTLSVYHILRPTLKPFVKMLKMCIPQNFQNVNLPLG